jgi:hypothetical protein
MSKPLFSHIRFAPPTCVAPIDYQSRGNRPSVKVYIRRDAPFSLTAYRNSMRWDYADAWRKDARLHEKLALSMGHFLHVWNKPLSYADKCRKSR